MTVKKTINVLIADDHGVVRMGLSAMLASEPDIRVVGLAPNGEAAFSMAAELSPDIVVMDLKMPRMDGLESTRRICSELPGTKVVVLTSYGITTMIAGALDAGASGAVMKSAEDSEIVTAIRTIAEGGKYISRDIVQELDANPPVPAFTPRQKEILASMVRGLTNNDIAVELGISRDSVGEYITAILKKLGAANRTEAVAIALRKQLI